MNASVNGMTPQIAQVFLRYYKGAYVSTDCTVSGANSYLVIPDVQSIGFNQDDDVMIEQKCGKMGIILRSDYGTVQCW